MRIAKSRFPRASVASGMLFQHYALFPHRTVAENIAFGSGRAVAATSKNKRCGLSNGPRPHLGPRPSATRANFPAESSNARPSRAHSQPSRKRFCWTNRSRPWIRICEARWKRNFRKHLPNSNGPFCSLPTTSKRPTAGGPTARAIARPSRGIWRKGQVFRHPPTVEVARLTGCKNFSRAKAISSRAIEAIDWGCRLTVAQPIAGTPAHVGIRAHHVDFVEAASRSDAGRQCLSLLARPLIGNTFSHHALLATSTAAWRIRATTICKPRFSRKSGCASATGHFPGTFGFRRDRLFLMPE